MAKEGGERRDPLATVGQIEIWETHIGRQVNGIPSDAEYPHRLEIMSYGNDTSITMEDFPEENLIPFMRFRSYSGGGMFPHIPPILNWLAYDLETHQGQIPPDYEDRKWPRMDGTSAFTGSPDYSKMEVKKGKNKDEPKYLVKGIPDEEEGKEQFLDIEVAQDGDVAITMRNELFNKEGTMVFRTAENGGKYPILAAAFTKIAEIIVESQSKNPPAYI